MHNELGIVVWADFSFGKREQKTVVNTITAKKSRNPQAFPINQLKSAVPKAKYSTFDDFTVLFLSSSEQEPLVISLETAEKHLGWTDFDVPPSFLE